MWGKCNALINERDEVKEEIEDLLEKGVGEGTKKGWMFGVLVKKFKQWMEGSEEWYVEFKEWKKNESAFAITK